MFGRIPRHGTKAHPRPAQRLQTRAARRQPYPIPLQGHRPRTIELSLPRRRAPKHICTPRVLAGCSSGFRYQRIAARRSAVLTRWQQAQTKSHLAISARTESIARICALPIENSFLPRTWSKSIAQGGKTCLQSMHGLLFSSERKDVNHLSRSAARLLLPALLVSEAWFVLLCARAAAGLAVRHSRRYSARVFMTSALPPRALAVSFTGIAGAQGSCTQFISP